MGKKSNVNPEVFREDVRDIYAEKKGISKSEAEERIDDVLTVITDLLVAGNDVKLHKFFNFLVRKRGEKKGKNPTTEEDMIIPETTTIVARMTASMKRRIQGKEQ